ncbi:unnamed protein product [Polarella glacialis]|uniref:FACT complex subunit SSRP1 n=1 Tax=Polarella glacialis TaxID=89957 RepID=A0A813EXE4_POLGL|nr:unnamed protein product [Polarella glacialis]
MRHAHCPAAQLQLLLWLLLAAGAAFVVAGSGGLVVSGGKGGSGQKRPKGAFAVAKDIERRVMQAGGKVEGVMVVSLSWTSADDLDLHVALPGGTEINFGHKKIAGGELDVDMCVRGRHSGLCADRPVENVVFMDQPAAGRYRVYVQNFNYHLNTLPENMQVARMQEGTRASKQEQALRLSQNRPVLFDLLVKVEGHRKLFQGLCTPTGKTHAASNVPVFEFDYEPDAEDEDDRLVPHFEASEDMECQTYTQKLLAASEGRERLPGGSSSQPATRQDSSVAGGRGAKGTKKASSKKKKGSSAQAKKEDSKQAALQAVRASSRPALLSKPVSALRALLGDIGTSCRGCLDKSEFVDKLLDAAGARSKAEL